jgi:hypothetical protein
VFKLLVTKSLLQNVNSFNVVSIGCAFQERPQVIKLVHFRQISAIVRSRFKGIPKGGPLQQVSNASLGLLLEGGAVAVAGRGGSGGRRRALSILIRTLKIQQQLSRSSSGTSSTISASSFSVCSFSLRHILS